MNNVYKNIKIGSNKEISSIIEKVEKATDSISVFIGLGGTGIDAIRTVKKTVYTNLKPDNFDVPDVDKPIYRNISFLGIDSDSSYGRYLEPNEFFYIGREAAMSFLHKDFLNKSALKDSKHLDWINKNLSIFKTNMNYGAGCVRQVGRYLFSTKAIEIYAKIRDLITSNILAMNPGTIINIYIMSGLCGGTGSGCYVDMCYLVKQVLYDMGYACASRISGFFFLPDFTFAHPNFPKGSPTEHVLKANGYAALKELDYLMNMPNNEGEFRHKYHNDIEVRQATAPVDFCYLISSIDANGNVHTCPEDVMEIVSEYVLNDLVDKRAVREYDIGIEAIRSNIDTLQANVCKHYSANYVYNIIGAVRRYIPYNDICAYYTTSFFDSIKYIKKNIPSKNDVENFCKNNGIDFKQLDMLIEQGTQELHIDPARFDVKELRSVPGRISGHLASYCEAWMRNYEHVVSKNIFCLEQDLDLCNVTDNSQSIICRIYNELVKIIKNPEFGPYFASRMIDETQEYNVLSTLLNIRVAIVNKRNDAIGQLSYMEKCECEAHNELCSTLLFFRDKKETYINAVENKYRTLAEIKKYEAFLDLIEKIMCQIKAINKIYFRKLLRIFDNRFEPFEKEKICATTTIKNNRSIVDVECIKGQLDEVVLSLIKRTENNLSVAHCFVEKFNTMLISNLDKWVDAPEDKIDELINEFFETEFCDVISLTVGQCIKLKYEAKTHRGTDNYIGNFIKEDVLDLCVPMFNYSSIYANNNNSTNYCDNIFLSIPDNEIQQYADVTHRCVTEYQIPVLINSSLFKDRITALRFCTGVPLYAYSQLKECKEDYERVKYDGIHLYECEEKDWRKLPSPIPKELS